MISDRKALCYVVFSTFHTKFTAKLKRIYLRNYFRTFPQTSETECLVNNYPVLSQPCGLILQPLRTIITLFNYTIR